MKNFFSLIVLMIVFLLMVSISCAPQYSFSSTARIETNTQPPATSALKPTKVAGNNTSAKPTRSANTSQDKGSEAIHNMNFEIPNHPIDVIPGRPTDDSITFSIMTYQNAECYIEFDLVPNSYTNQTPIYTLNGVQPVEILISGLHANTAYTYRVRYRFDGSGDFYASESATFFTQRARGSTFTYTIQADSHLDSNSSLPLYAQTLANERADHPDFVIDLGDTFMTDKYKPYTDAAPQYMAQRYFLSQLGAPLYLVLGNHDGEGAPKGQNGLEMSVWSAQLRTKYFPNPIPDDFYTGNSMPDKTIGALQDYYAWEWGDALFVVLDPYWFTPPQRGIDSDLWNPTLGQAQYQWLKTTLETSNAKWKFVFIHQLIGGADKNGRGGIEVAPFYEWGGKNADGSYGFDLKRPGWGITIHQLLIDNRVTAVFHGHDHLFVRQELDGIVYQEVPQPSAITKDNYQQAIEYGYTHGEVRSGSGHLKVIVSPDSVTIEYIRAILSQDGKSDQQKRWVEFQYTILANT